MFLEISFSNCSKLTEINLPSSILIIENFAFFGCTSLKKISIPPSVTKIGNSAFENCLSLITITIPSSLSSIGKYCFCNCRSLKEVNVKSLANKICDSSFRNCTSLKQIIFSELLIDEIGQHAFSGCSSLVQFSIPETVEKISCFAFKGCSFLTEIEIPFKITVIEPYTFADCSSIVKVKIPDSLEIIKDYAFNRCSKLSDISLPSSVKLIGDFAFGGCRSLKKLSVSPSVKINKERAFKNCDSLLKCEKNCSLPFLINEKLFHKWRHLSHEDHKWYIDDAYVVEDKKIGKSYIAKTFSKVDDDDDDKEENSFMNYKFENKLRLYMSTDHPTFINFLGYSFEKNKHEKLTVIMEKADNKSLQELFEDIQRNTLRQIILIGIARGMKYLLDCNKKCFICPRKILLDENFYPRINICDNDIMTNLRNDDFHPDYSDIVYLPPEFMDEDFEVNENSFVYSFAIIMYRIVTDSIAYDELRHLRNYQFLRKVGYGMRPQFKYDMLKNEIRELIEV